MLALALVILTSTLTNAVEDPARLAFEQADANPSAEELQPAGEAPANSALMQSDPNGDDFDGPLPPCEREAYWFKRCVPAKVYGGPGAPPTKEVCTPCMTEPAPMATCVAENGELVVIWDSGYCKLGFDICVLFSTGRSGTPYKFKSKREKPCGSSSTQLFYEFDSGGSGPSIGGGVNLGGVSLRSTTCCLYERTDEDPLMAVVVDCQ